ncbi:MAG: hypothetical protein KAG72_10810 [Abyssibacter sp.]|jgi:Mrp family chromosome partitioning ATPase|nr:hypothetical protein [Abyssibacter sp.]MCK5859824.1 hypothetical protein [Abyssibacter sp.]
MADSTKPTVKRGILATRIGGGRIIDAEASEQDSARLKRTLKSEQDTQPPRQAQARPRVAQPSSVVASADSPSRRQNSATSVSVSRAASRDRAAATAPRAEASFESQRLAGPESSSGRQPKVAPDLHPSAAIENGPEQAAPTVGNAAGSALPKALGPVATIHQVPLNPAQALVTVLRPESAESRNYRGLLARTMPRLEQMKKRAVVAFVSAGQSASRASVPANLAVMLSRSGRPTCLVDVGLQAGQSSALFGVAEQDGLASWLAGESGLSGYQFDELPEFTLITGGATQDRVFERVLHPRFREWLHADASRRGTVLLDATQVDGIADAQAVASVAGSAIVVIGRDVDPVSETRALVAELRSHGVELIGTVLLDRALA